MKVKELLDILKDCPEDYDIKFDALNIDDGKIRKDDNSHTLSLIYPLNHNIIYDPTKYYLLPRQGVED